MFDSQETISIANRLMDIFNQNDIPFRVRTSWPYFWYTVGVAETLKLFIIDRDGGDDLQATYRLLDRLPIPSGSIRKSKFLTKCVLLIALQMSYV